jgi:5-oxoprolinase (ATP-hydrolysing)
MPAAPEAALAGIQVMFETAYRQRFAFLMPGKALVDRGRVGRSGGRRGCKPAEHCACAAAVPARSAPRPVETVRMYTAGLDGRPAWHDAALIVREDLRPGDVVDGRPSSPSRTPPPWSSPAGACA